MERGKILSIVGLIAVISAAAMITGGLLDKSRRIDSGGTHSAIRGVRAINAGKADAAGSGSTEITISRRSQRLSGIRVRRVRSFWYRDEIKTYGQVVDLSGLIESMDNFVTAEAAARKAVLKLALSRNEYVRARTLFNSTKYVSLQQLQDAEAAYYSDVADSESAFQNMSGI